MNVLSDRYIFMKILKNEYDFEKMGGFTYFGLVYDKKENGLFNFTVYNTDYSMNKAVNMLSKPFNNEVAILESLPAAQLVEAYGNDELRGKLREIASGLNEESNSVIMLLKHKK